jgi:small-conductance mechanosensitive channel
VNVGDVVEIGTRTGVMKSIGFRSSVLYTWDGADVVIPNGDLLNQHLVNWTLANISRRIEILVGVAYGTDLKKVKEILKNLVTNDERILQSPTPDVLIKEFANSAINVQVFFWVRNVREGLAVKSDVISAIDIAFKENNIVIPFPQQDVHIHSFNDVRRTDNSNEDDQQS